MTLLAVYSLRGATLKNAGMDEARVYGYIYIYIYKYIYIYIYIVLFIYI